MNQEDKTHLYTFIEQALREDVGEGDHTSLATIPPECMGLGEVLIKESGVLAGVEEALAVLEQVDPTLNIQVFRQDGEQVEPSDIIIAVHGRIHSILKAERLLLNIMQRMSGIATLTRRISELIRDTGTKLLDTRKTTPLLRYFEKKAVRIGGGVNHRFGLYDMILIKDNHVDATGGIVPAIRAANAYRERLGKSIEIEIEVRNRSELEEVMSIGQVDRIMLDNFSPGEVREAILKIDGRFVTEASGGITEETIREYALAGVDYVSMGALTHSVKSLDISLKAKASDQPISR